MASGFGEVGAEIVARNMKGAGTKGIDTNVEGRKVVAVFGFVRILDFGILAERLQERVMELANAVALQVHLSAAMSAGSANKIVGGEFRLVRMRECTQRMPSLL